MECKRSDDIVNELNDSVVTSSHEDINCGVASQLDLIESNQIKVDDLEINEEKPMVIINIY